MGNVIFTRKLHNGNNVIMFEATEEMMTGGPIYTDIGTFSEGQFVLQKPTECFGKSNTMALLIPAGVDCAGMHEVSSKPI